MAQEKNVTGLKALKAYDTRKLVLLGLLTAIVVVMQFIGAAIRFGTFSVSLVMLPIVVGATLLGVFEGAWLGLAFGITVLLSGDAGIFIAFNPFGAILVVLLKGMLAGFVAGAAYRVCSGINRTGAALLSAMFCPLVNTGVFFVGVYAFFMPLITDMSRSAGFGDAASFIFIGLIGLNFIFELGLNIVLCPVIIRLIQYGQNRRAG